MKKDILKILKDNKDVYVSGQKISKILNVSRTAIWKHMNGLKEEGYKIESVSRKGYKLIASPDLLTPEEILPLIKTKNIGRSIVHFHSIKSTNMKAKELASNSKDEGEVVISEEQTMGRGRLGRKWISPKGKGIWMSIILRPQINPINVPKVTQIVAAAVTKAFGEIGVKNYIKWPNDIIINNKKVCGILTEMSGELNRINYVVVGIGINANIEKNDFPSEITDIATSIKIETGKGIQRKELVAHILNNFEKLYDDLVDHNNIDESIKICKDASILIGKRIKVIRNNKKVDAQALDLTKEGKLVVRYDDGEIEELISGEVSVRGLYGYV